MIGAAWRRSLPPHWGIARICDHAVVLNGYPFDSERFSTSDGMPLVRIRDMASEETEVRYAGEPVPEAVVHRGDILIGMDGEFNSALWKGEDALLNQRVCCVRPRQTVDARFLAYVLPFPLRLINEFTYSTTVKHLSSFDVLKIRFPLPILETQRAIADHLDRETARLDGLVAAKERVLGLLGEKRRALITRAVTRGLDPRASLRDSGIPWLDEIPAHWAATRLKFVAEVRGGLTLGKNYGAGTLVRYPYLRVANVQDGHIDLSDVEMVLVPEAEAESCLLEAGDVLMTEGGDADKLGRGCMGRRDCSLPSSEPCIRSTTASRPVRLAKCVDVDRGCEDVF